MSVIRHSLPFEADSVARPQLPGRRRRQALCVQPGAWQHDFGQRRSLSEPRCRRLLACDPPVSGDRIFDLDLALFGARDRVSPGQLYVQSRGALRPSGPDFAGRIVPCRINGLPRRGSPRVTVKCLAGARYRRGACRRCVVDCCARAPLLHHSGEAGAVSRPVRWGNTAQTTAYDLSRTTGPPPVPTQQR